MFYLFVEIQLLLTSERRQQVELVCYPVEVVADLREDSQGVPATAAPWAARPVPPADHAHRRHLATPTVHHQGAA